MRLKFKSLLHCFGAIALLIFPSVLVAQTPQIAQIPVVQDAEQVNSSSSTPSSVFDGGPDAKAPVLIKADEISNDQDLGIIVAKGNVEIAQGARVLIADTLSYSQKSNTVTASGNVTIMEPSGEVFFASYVELTDNLKDGIVEKIQILLSDNARISANGAKRSGGNRTDMVKAVYSPCEVCKEDPSRAPLWQIKADQVIHDQKTHLVEYVSATMEIGGIPIMYIPYFSHADPTIKRKTGFLIPRAGSSTDTGAFAQIPYFIALSDDKDITIDPIYTADEGVFFSGEYRQRFLKGEVEISGSLGTADRTIGQAANGTNIVNQDEWRGHVFAKGNYDINETWRAGFDINRSTDQSYLKRFDFWGDPGNAMTSNIYAEGFRKRNYISANAYTFQDLRSGNRPNTPLIFPLIDYNGIGGVDDLGGRWSLDSNFRALQREDSANSLRTSVIGGYEVPFTANAGHVTTLSAELRGDAYYTNQNTVTDNFGRPVSDGTDMRLHGSLGIDWRYPFARNSTWGYQLIEPVAALYLAPNSDVTAGIRNEDSTVIESDDTNLFSANRAPGLDIIEGGIRGVYGIKIANYFEEDGLFSAFVGQSYKFNNESQEFTQTTLLEEHRSDILGRMSLRANKYLNLQYRFALDETEHEFNRNELGFSVGIPALRFSGDYTYVRNPENPNEVDVEEINLAATTKIDDFWAMRAHVTRDLSDNGGTRKAGLGVSYEDECLILTASIERDYTEDVDFGPSDSFLFRITFKTLGEVDLIQ